MGVIISKCRNMIAGSNNSGKSSGANTNKREDPPEDQSPSGLNQGVNEDEKRTQNNGESKKTIQESENKASDAEKRRQTDNKKLETSQQEGEGTGTPAPTLGENTEPKNQAGTSPPPGPSTPTQNQGNTEPKDPAGTSPPPGPSTSTRNQGNTEPKNPAGTPPPPGPSTPTQGENTEPKDPAGTSPPQGPSTPTQNQGNTEPTNPAGTLPPPGPSTPSQNQGNTEPKNPALTSRPPGPSTPSQNQGNTEPKNPAGTPPPPGPSTPTQNRGNTEPKDPAGASPPPGPSTPTQNQGNTEPKDPAGTPPPPGPSTPTQNQGNTEPKNPAGTPPPPGPSTPTQNRGNTESKDPAGTSPPPGPLVEGNEDTRQEGEKKSENEKKKESGKGDEDPSSPSGDNANNADANTTINPSPSSGTLSQGGGDPQGITHGDEKHRTSTKGNRGPPQVSQDLNPHPSGQNSGNGTSNPIQDPDSVPQPQEGGGDKSDTPKMRNKTASGAETEPWKTASERTGSLQQPRWIGHAPPSSSDRASSAPRTTTRPVVPGSTGPSLWSQALCDNLSRAVIFSLEEDNDTKSLEKWMRSFITGCHHINPTKTEDWKALVENPAIVIVYHASSSYESFMKQMGQYMDHWKGNKKVIVVIGDIQAPEEEVRSEWEVHKFTKAELQWILQDPRLQEMSGKIQQIRDTILRVHQEMNLMKKLKLPVKFVSMSDIEEPQNTIKGKHWLPPLLGVDGKVEFTFSKISKIKDLLKEKKKTGPMCILHLPTGTFRKNITELQYIMTQKERNHLSVVVVLDDLDNENAEEDLRAVYDSECRDLGPLFLFRREERQPQYLSYVSSEEMVKEKWSKLQKSIETRVKEPEARDTPDATSCPPPGETRNPGTLGIVSIFSRSSNKDYSWIETQLKSTDLSSVVSTVRPFYISNNQSGKFFEELGLCSFGILYHTKNRGRVNVTDVTDSLYDEELKYMSELLSRENVIVVIDDLKDSHIEEKRRILANQPSIDTYAFDLLLFSEQEKKDGEHVQRLREAILSLAAGKKTSAKAQQTAES